MGRLLEEWEGYAGAEGRVFGVTTLGVVCCVGLLEEWEGYAGEERVFGVTTLEMVHCMLRATMPTSEHERPTHPPPTLRLQCTSAT